MTRVGWIVLGLIVAAVATFAALWRSGPAALPRVTAGPSTSVPAGPTGSLIVPVAGVARDGFTDTWGQARGAGREHHGTDIPAPGGTPVLAAGRGTVEKLFRSDRGGITLYERSPDRRWTFYYAHLRGYAPGLHEGQRVLAGQLLGFVGDTGDAGPGNTHLHFGLTRTAPDQRWYQGDDVNAFPYLHTGAALP